MCMYCDSDYVTDARLDAVYCVTIYGDGNISVNTALGWCSPLLQGILYHISTVKEAIK